MTGPDASAVIRDMCDLWPDERARTAGTVQQYTRRLLAVDVQDARVGIARLADTCRRPWPLWSEVREAIDGARQDREAAESARRLALPESTGKQPLSAADVANLSRTVAALMRGEITSDEYRRRVAAATRAIRGPAAVVGPGVWDS